MWKCVGHVVLRCDVTQWVVEWRELCWSKLYFIYMICISMLSCFSLLVRNVLTHSLCVVCVWILWWSQTLCSREQMVRWMNMENLMLEDAGTQCFDRMWHWDMGFYINCMKFWTCSFYHFVSHVESLVHSLEFWKALFKARDVFNNFYLVTMKRMWSLLPTWICLSDLCDTLYPSHIY